MRTAVILILAALAVAACGKQGVLERPDPLFGRPADPPETRAP
jgi:predicted small lipoprotein YifL